MTLKVRDTTCGPYPVDRLVGCETALIMFAAAFAGINEGAWINDAGLTAVCVDNDKDALDAMRPLYPDDWHYICRDAYFYAEYAAILGGQWDVVSLDPFTNEFQRCADNVEAWCRLAKQTVILGTGRDTVVISPHGWEIVDRMHRTDYAGGVYWTVLERTQIEPPRDPGRVTRWGAGC